MSSNCKFSPGMRIIVRNEEWLVKKVETNSMDNQALFCVGISDLVKDYETIFLSDVEKDNIEIVDPENVEFIVDDSKNFSKSKLYIESELRKTIPTDEKIHIGNKACMDIMNYQLEPTALALSKTRQRILIADTVGLGKTLEAGILITELIKRGKGNRILVVTVKSMMTQFQKELWNRFTIPLTRLDSSKIHSISEKLPTNYNPFYYYDKTIVSIDTLKNDLSYRTYIENCFWDIIVIDEAHNVAIKGDKKSQRGKLANLLAKKSDTLILLTATPHDGKSESFASLMNMLDPTAIADVKNYTKEDIKDLCIRRFKKDVENDVLTKFKDPLITKIECKASKKEEEAFKVFTDMILDMDIIRKRKNPGQLFKTGLEKTLFSSPSACIKSIKERENILDNRFKEEIQNGIEVKDIEKLETLRKSLENINKTDFSKYVKLLELLKDKSYDFDLFKNNDRLVIFTERIETMKYLVKNLREDLNLDDTEVVEMYGGMSDLDIQKVVDDFGRQEAPIKILVASDVASEGLNLHYLCHRLIHFDIPWSPIVFQQRNGRIDRYGQTIAPDIRYFVISSDNEKIKGDVRILEILVEKEKEAHKNIGDPAVLMGKFNQEDEEIEIAKAIEKDVSTDEFIKTLEKESDEFNPFELLMKQNTKNIEIVDDISLYSNIDYIIESLKYMSDKNDFECQNLQSVDGIEIKISKECKKRLRRVLPAEVLPVDDKIRLCNDKNYCIQEIKKSLGNNIDENSWPKVQYLWDMHPFINYIGEKNSLLFNRSNAPLLVLKNNNLVGKYIYIVSGTIPNRKSNPVVYDWFGLLFSDDIYEQNLSLKEIIDMTDLKNKNIPNINKSNDEINCKATTNIKEVIKKSYEYMETKYNEYRDRTEPYIDIELKRLEKLEAKHKEVNLLDLLGLERQKSEKEREIEEMFSSFSEWEKDTLRIENVPYVKIICCITGVE